MFPTEILTRSGESIFFPSYTDSPLVLSYLADNLDQDECLYVEYPHIALDDPETYTIRPITRRPGWCSNSFLAASLKRMRRRIRRMILSSPKECLIGGCWVLRSGVEVQRVVGGRVVGMLGNSRIRMAGGSTWIGTMQGSSRVDTLTDNAMVEQMLEASIVGVAKRCSLVHTMLDAAQITRMDDRASVEVMLDEAFVGQMGGYSHIHILGGMARVGELLDHASIFQVTNQGSIGVIRGNACVGEMGGNSYLISLHDKASVEVLCESATIARVSGAGRVGEMGGKAVVEEIEERGELGRIGGESRVGEDKRSTGAWN